MDEEKQVENQVPEETEIVESPTTEEKSEVETPKEEVDAKPVEKRIHRLVDQRNDAQKAVEQERAEKESLAKQVEELTAMIGGNQGGFPDVQTLEPGTEVTSEQYKADVVRTAQSIAQLEVQKQKMLDTITRESEESMKTHPELDPKSDKFDKELSDTITDSVRAQIQTNPTASVKKLVNSLMKPYRRSVEKQVAENTEIITKQVSETALRPSQVKGVEKSFEELSLDEMEKKLGAVY